jgi:SAM-dependent methyltransferase
MLKNNDFYNLLSDDYDDMINFEKAFENRIKVFKNLLPEKIASAADLGCGTGLDSITLSKLGIKVTAFDLSLKMLEIARFNSARYEQSIDFHKTSITKINRKYFNQFDLVVSLGNALANLNIIELKSTLKNAYSLLKSNGLILMQILNYHSVVKKDERIINITQNKEKYFVRFYDFLKDLVNFNVISFNKDLSNRRDIITTRIYPHKKEDIIPLLKAIGFKKIKIYGGYDNSKYERITSKDLIIFAKK